MNWKTDAEWRIGLLIFITAFAIFRLSPVRQIADSKYSMLLGEQLLKHHTFVLDRAMFPSIPRDKADADLLQIRDTPYQIQPVRGRLFYWYPPGSSVLSLPYIALMNAV